MGTLTGTVILRHAFRMVFNNLGAVMRLTLPAFIAFAVLQIFSPSEVFIPLAQPEAITKLPEGYGTVVLIALGYAFLSFICMAIIAVLWHRHVLLASDEAASPKDVPAAVVLFLIRSFIIGLVIVGITLPVVMVAGIIGTMTGAFPVLLLLSSLLIVWITLRLSLGLPAAAIGKVVGLKDSWDATAPVANALWPVALVEMALQIVGGSLPYVGLLITWLALLIGASVLTTLYGVLVERRPLPSE